MIGVTLFKEIYLRFSASSEPHRGVVQELSKEDYKSTEDER
jgi:hypothetical protein